MRPKQLKPPPISFDYMVSMEHGPVLSRTLDLINGFVKDRNGDQWDAWISGREAHNVALKKSASRDCLDHLSDASAWGNDSYSFRPSQ
ncbi:MAG: hypothetical protein OXF66_01955 [Gammaproteobacteria bacterium]|nr:hypothetical protein [Gammaproteobacteria bacterium]